MIALVVALAAADPGLDGPSGLPPVAGPEVTWEPPWVRTIRLPDARAATGTACEAPPLPKAVPTPGTPPAATPPGVLVVDPAHPEALPAEVQAAIQAGRPYDLAALPIEPLRGRPADLARVRDVLTAVDAGAGARIAVWGASHVAGERWTGELRRLLQARGGDGGHGWVLPAEPWRWWSMQDVRWCGAGWSAAYDGHDDGALAGRGLLGPAGVALDAGARAWGWVETAPSGPGSTASRIEVWLLDQPTGGQLELRVDGVVSRVSTRGASGPRAVVFDVPDAPHHVDLRPVGDGPVRVLGVGLYRDEGVVVEAMGVNGRRASSWTRWDPALQRAFLVRSPPDLAILAYGTNEANDPDLTPEAYAASLRDSLRRMRAVLPDAACVLVGPSDRAVPRDGGWGIWPATAWIAEAQRRIGPEYGCVTWDLQQASGGPGSMGAWRRLDPSLGANDGIHFTPEGYRELAGRFLAAWGAVSPRSGGP